MPPTVDPACTSQYDGLDEGADEAAGKGTQKVVGGEEAEEEKKREEDVGRTLRGVWKEEEEEEEKEVRKRRTRRMLINWDILKINWEESLFSVRC
jgi:hypothetical protein